MAEYEAFRNAPTPQGLKACGSCGRTFNPDVLVKHEKICTNLKKRKVFDITKQRLQGLDVVPGKKTGHHKVQSSRIPSNALKPKKDWRQRHEELINTIRSARTVTAAVKAGGPLPPPPPPTYDPDYVQCPYCNRRFNESAAERHMNFCKEQTSRIGGSSNKAVRDKLNKRTQYKPPLPGARKHSSSGQTPARAQASVVPARKVPSESPKLRRRVAEEAVDYNSSESQMQRRGKASPPIQRRTLVLNRGHEQDTEDEIESKRYVYSNGVSDFDAGYRSGELRQAASVQSKSSHKKGPGRDPQWFEDLKKEKSYTPPDSLGGRSSSGKSELSSGVSESGSARSRRHGSGYSEDRSGPFFDMTEVPKQRRLPKHENVDDFDDRSSKVRNRGVNGVPSYRKESPKVDRDLEERTPSGRQRLANFCHECGTKYPVAKAKFCCECGMRRMHIE